MFNEKTLGCADLPPGRNELWLLRHSAHAKGIINDEGRWQIAKRDRAALGADRKALRQVLELADVARPGIAFQLANHRRRNLAALAMHLPEVKEERRDVARAFAQGR